MEIIDDSIAELEQAFWLVGHPEYDEAYDFCLTCANRAAKDYEDVILGGGYLVEHDSPPICHTCFKSLAAIILPDGFVVDSEESLAEWAANNPE